MTPATHTPDAQTLQTLLAKTSALHDHLCPRQILGVRTALLAAQFLHLPFPQTDKRVLTFVETDGCYADGVAVASGCTLGHRTLRLMDYGKIAATFVDTRSGQAIRIAPRTDLRQHVKDERPHDQKRYDAYLQSYQTLPDDKLLTVQNVEITLDIEHLVSVHGKRVVCDTCGEEIINEREVPQNGRTLCRACTGEHYYTPLT